MYENMGPIYHIYSYFIVCLHCPEEKIESSYNYYIAAEIMNVEHYNKRSMPENLLAQLRAMGGMTPLDEAEVEYLWRHHVRLFCYYRKKRLEVAHEEEREACAKLAWARAVSA